MLILKIERGDGSSQSIGRYRVFAAGVLSESSDADAGGRGKSQKVTLEKIADDGVVITFEMCDRVGEEFEQEIFLRYGPAKRVDLSHQATLVAKLEAHQ